MSTGNYKDASKAIYRYLTDDGLVVDATNYEMAVNGGTPVPFYFTADAPCRLRRMLTFIQDNGSWTEEKFASITALTNGMDLVVERNGATIASPYGGLTVKNNAQWARHCFDRRILTVGSGDTMLTSRFTLEKGGQDMLLRKGDTIKSTVSDNLSTLVSMTHMIQGYYL